jgi:hypothetical protein
MFATAYMGRKRRGEASTIAFGLADKPALKLFSYELLCFLSAVAAFVIGRNAPTPERKLVEYGPTRSLVPPAEAER